MKYFLSLLLSFLFLTLMAQTDYQFVQNPPLPGSFYIYYPGNPSITTADMNNDQYPDLIVGGSYNINYNGGYSLVFIYNPQTKRYLYIDTLRDNNGNILFGYQPVLDDIDYDQVPDLFIRPNYNVNMYLWYKMTSLGKFQLVDTLKDTNGNVIAMDCPPVFYDYDADSLKDMYSFLNYSFSYWHNQGNNTFASQGQVYINNGNFSFPSAIVRPDFYMTDSLRLIVSTASDGIFRFTMESPDKFTGGSLLTHYPGNAFSGTMTEAVIDTMVDDKGLDLLFTAQNKAIFHYIDTMGFFDISNYVVADNYIVRSSKSPSLCFYDYSNDGKKDLFISDDKGHVIFSLNVPQNGYAYFARPDSIKDILNNIYEFGGPVSLAMGDFDNNYFKDLLVGTQNGLLLRYEASLGTDFYFKDTLASFPGKISIAGADINNDGKEEILISTPDNDLRIYNYDGTTLDSIGGIQFLGSYPIISLGDMNNDGYPDLVFLHDNTYLGIWLNDKNGSFYNPNEGYNDYPVGYNTGIGIIDVDMDGKNDIVLGRLYGETLVLLNKTDFSTASVTMLSPASIGIYPNPATDFITIDREANVTGVKIISLSGKIIKNINGAIRTIPVADLDKGVYLLEISTPNRSYRQKFIKL